MKSAYKTLFFLACMLLSVQFSWAGAERIFREFKASDGLADNSVQTIICTRTGRLAISTLGSINFYEGVQFSYINMDTEESFPLPNYHGNDHMYFDSFHHLWLKSIKGVQCVDLTYERPINNVDSVFRSLGADGSVDDMFVDANGQVWMMLGDQMYGCVCRKRYPVLSGLNLQDLEVYNNHLLMFYENGEMMEFDLHSDTIVYRGRAYDASESKLYCSSSVLLPDGRGIYQIRNGEKESILLHLDMPSHQWTVIQRLDYHMNNMAIYKDVLYVPTEWGYWTYHTKTHELEHKLELRLRDGGQLTTGINTVAFDRQGGMWLGTENRGLLYSRSLAIPFKAYPWSDPMATKYAQVIDTSHANKVISEFNGKKANCLYVDSRHRTWVGTTKGLDYYVSPQAEPIHITTKNGLLNNVVHSIIEDNLHNLWVATSYGISCVVMHGDSVRYTMSYNDLIDDIPNETFVDGRVAKLPDGLILMQSLDHVVAFNPGTFRMLTGKAPFTIKPKLIRLMVNGSIVQPNTEVDGTLILDRAISRVTTINVNYDQNSLSLLFCGLNYIRPLQTYYRVRVKGVINEWHVYSYYNSNGKVDADGLLHLPLTSLNPGTYTIELQVSVHPDRWDGEPYTWTINVNEPWWRTRGVVALLAIVLLVLVVVNFAIYNYNTRLKMRRNSEESDVLRRISNFVERCDSFSGEVLAPSLEDMYSDGTHLQSELSDEFIDIMTAIVPYVHRSRGTDLSMHAMSQLTGVPLPQLYELMTANLYKNPRPLARTLRLQKAAQLLTTTNHPVEHIAAECGFVSTNYFIANFFHRYRQTPADYRNHPSP